MTSTARQGGEAGGRIVFRAGGKGYALPSARVREVARLPRLTRVPLAPPGLLGLAPIRGEVLAVLSPAALDPGQPRRLLVLAGADPVALAVDGIERIGRDDAENVADLPLDALIARAFPIRQSARRAGHARTASGVRANSADHLTLLSMAVGQQSFALPVEEVAEVARVPAGIARLPGADAAVVGTMAWRDRTIGLFSLATLLGLDARTIPSGRSRVVIALLGGHGLGLLVDTVEGLVSVPQDRIDPVPDILLRDDAEARLRAICRLPDDGRLLSIIGANYLLSEARTRRLAMTGARDRAGTDHAREQADRVSILPTRIGGHRIAFPLTAIEQVGARPARLTPLPAAPPWLLGIATVEGEPIPVIDQSLRLAGTPCSGVRQRLLVLRAAGQRLGFLVDEAQPIIRTERDRLTPAPLPDDLAAGIFGDALRLEDGAETLLTIEPVALISSAEQALLAHLAA